MQLRWGLSNPLSSRLTVFTYEANICKNYFLQCIHIHTLCQLCRNGSAEAVRSFTLNSFIYCHLLGQVDCWFQSFAIQMKISHPQLAACRWCLCHIPWTAASNLRYIDAHLQAVPVYIKLDRCSNQIQIQSFIVTFAMQWILASLSLFGLILLFKTEGSVVAMGKIKNKTRLMNI